MVVVVAMWNLIEFLSTFLKPEPFWEFGNLNYNEFEYLVFYLSKTLVVGQFPNELNVFKWTLTQSHFVSHLVTMSRSKFLIHSVNDSLNGICECNDFFTYTMSTNMQISCFELIFHFIWSSSFSMCIILKHSKLHFLIINWAEMECFCNVRSLYSITKPSA